jgi:DNA-binding transcriptional ArsR family regulator
LSVLAHAETTAAAARFFRVLGDPTRLKILGLLTAGERTELIEAGKFRPVIDRRYPLEDVIQATRYVETQQKTGNVVLTVNGGRARRVEP